MSEQASKHTPGPWRVHAVNHDAWTRQVWTDEAHGSVMIATTGGVDKDANARLIAATPEMLEALRECADALAKAFPSKIRTAVEHPALDAARAAIAKATGGSDHA